MGRPDFEDLEVYQLAEKFANKIWSFVQEWNFFAKDTIGKQIVRAGDSICANIAEGRGRYNYQDNQRFIKIARGSLYETISLLRLGASRFCKYTPTGGQPGATQTKPAGSRLNSSPRRRTKVRIAATLVALAF